MTIKFHWQGAGGQSGRVQGWHEEEEGGALVRRPPQPPRAQASGLVAGGAEKHRQHLLV